MKKKRILSIIVVVSLLANIALLKVHLDFKNETRKFVEYQYDQHINNFTNANKMLHNFLFLNDLNNIKDLGSAKEFLTKSFDNVLNINYFGDDTVYFMTSIIAQYIVNLRNIEHMLLEETFDIVYASNIVSDINIITNWLENITDENFYNEAEFKDKVLPLISDKEIQAIYKY